LSGKKKEHSIRGIPMKHVLWIETRKAEEIKDYKGKERKRKTLLHRVREKDFSCLRSGKPAMSWTN